MELTAKVNRHEHINYWIKTWNGWSNLTEKEQHFLGELVFRAMDMAENGVSEPYLGQLLFSASSLNDIKTKMELTKQGVTNYKAQLKKKGVIYQDENGEYHLDPKMIPQNKLTINFVYNGD